MSFGTKQYQHRFYTTPKLRDRHITDFISPQPISNRYGSISAFTPFPTSPYPIALQPSMKQSYIRLINNGMNSRLYTKDELGYQGVKFEKDVISRYCGDDYKRNAEVLERFKREAEEKRKREKYKHLRGEDGGGIGFESNYYSNRPAAQYTNTGRNNLSLLPITNSSGGYHQRSISSPQKLLSIKNTQNLINSSDHNMNICGPNHNYHTMRNSHLLPLLREDNQSSFNKNNKQFHRAIEEEQSHNQNQENGEGIGKRKVKQSLKHSIVRDVGINADLTTQQSTQPYKKRNSQQLLKGNSKLYDRKKSQSLRIQTMKLKNKSMKKKYSKLKKLLLEKSVLLQKQQQFEEERIDMKEERMQRDKFRELQAMIQDLCNKLRENNSKIQGRVQTSGRSETNQQTTNRASGKQPNEYGQKPLSKDLQNQTQINTLKSSRLQQQQSPFLASQQQSSRIKQLLKHQQMAENIHTYQQQLQKIQSYRSRKPKIVYSINNHQKILKHDGLRLLKNRIQEKHFHINVLTNYSLSKERSKTQADR